jgi:hypothetical protein
MVFSVSIYYYFLLALQSNVHFGLCVRIYKTVLSFLELKKRNGK